MLIFCLSLIESAQQCGLSGRRLSTYFGRLRTCFDKQRLRLRFTKGRMFKVLPVLVPLGDLSVDILILEWCR